jgi:hypothetical protein
MSYLDDLNGLYWAELTPEDRRLVERAVAEGRARKVYSGVLGKLGMARVEIIKHHDPASYRVMVLERIVADRDQKIARLIAQQESALAALRDAKKRLLTFEEDSRALAEESKAIIAELMAENKRLKSERENA